MFNAHFHTCMHMHEITYFCHVIYLIVLKWPLFCEGTTIADKIYYFLIYLVTF